MNKDLLKGLQMAGDLLGKVMEEAGSEIDAKKEEASVSQKLQSGKEKVEQAVKTASQDAKKAEKKVEQSAQEVLKELKKGDAGDAVKELQAWLLLRGFHCGDCGADGDYGESTVKAVKKVQRTMGLEESGICDVKTHKALRSMKRSVFKKHELTDEEIRKITSLCIQEQGGTKAGIMWEASQMCNLWESKSEETKKKYDNSIYKFIRNSGWYAKSAFHMDNENGSETQREYVREVMCKGMRRLPLCIDEHDCTCDLKDVPKKPLVGSTPIQNIYDAKYTFFGVSASGDYFGAINYKKNQPYFTIDGKLVTN